MTQLQYKTVHPFTKDYQKVREVYLSVFPENERFPYFLLILSGYRPKHHLQAIYDGEQFVGMVYYFMTKDFFYLLFLGVSPKAQSNGYGGKIIADLKEQAGNRAFVLTAEELDDNAENSTQRKRRISFYERHGFSISPYIYVEKDDRYHVMTTKTISSQERLEQVFKQAVWNLVPVRIEKEK